MSGAFTSHVAEVRGVQLHYLLGGDPDGTPVLLWHGFLSTGHVWRKVMPALAEAGLAVLVPDMRGYGDSDKPGGVEGYDGRALAEDFRALVTQIGFGGGRPLTLAAHDMGAPPALLWAADHPEEVERLFYVEEPVLLPDALQKIITYTPQAAATGSMWWWLLPLAPGVPETLIVGNERAFLDWFFDRSPSFERGDRPRSARRGAADLRRARGRAGRARRLPRGVRHHRADRPVAGEQDHRADHRPRRRPGQRRARARHGRARGLRRQWRRDRGGHFLPEERPEAIIAQILGVTAPTEGAAT